MAKKAIDLLKDYGFTDNEDDNEDDIFSSTVADQAICEVGDYNENNDSLSSTVADQDICVFFPQL